MMKSSTAKARCWAKCPATNGSVSPTCAPCWPTNGFSPANNCLMMGCEFGQSSEWNANASLDWWLLDQGPYHRGVQRLVRDLNRLYLNEPALWEADYDRHGFSWIDCGDADNSVLSFVRQNWRRHAASGRHPEFDARLAAQLSRRPAPRRILARGPQHRLRLLRRQQPGQFRRRPRRAITKPTANPSPPFSPCRP